MDNKELLYFEKRFDEILSLLKPMPTRVGDNEISLEDAVREAVEAANGICLENPQLAKTVFWDHFKAKIGQVPSVELAAHTRDDLLVCDKNRLGLNLFVLF